MYNRSMIRMTYITFNKLLKVHVYIHHNREKAALSFQYHDKSIEMVILVNTSTMPSKVMHSCSSVFAQQFTLILLFSSK